MGKYDPVPFLEEGKKMVRIISVNLNDLTAVANNSREGKVLVSLDRANSGIVHIPQVGEEWIIEKAWDEWFLFARTHWQNPLFTNDLTQGEDRIGGNKLLVIQADKIRIDDSSSATELSATLNTGMTGFIKCKIGPIGNIYCWGEVGIAATVTSNTEVLLGTFTDPSGFILSPASDRYFQGNGNPTNQGVRMRIHRTSNTTQIYGNGLASVTISIIQFSTSWLMGY